MRSFCCFLALIVLAAFQAPAQAPAAGAQNFSAMLSYYRGRDLEAANRMAEAIPHYNEAVRISLDDISRNVATRDSYVILIRALRRLNRHAEVISWGRLGMGAFPDEFRLLETMGQSFFFMGDFGQSLAYMERYTHLLPDGDRVALAYFFIGEIFRLTHKYHRADMAYTAALFAAPNMALWWYRLGSVRERVGDREPAMEAYRRAIELNPNLGGARIGLARLAGD